MTEVIALYLVGRPTQPEFFECVACHKACHFSWGNILQLVRDQTKEVIICDECLKLVLAEKHPGLKITMKKDDGVNKVVMV